MEKKKNTIISVTFLFFIITVLILIRGDKLFVHMIQVGYSSIWNVKTEERATMDVISDHLLEKFPLKQDLLEISGRFLKICGVRSYYNNTNGINITKNGYNVGRYAFTSTDYEVEQMISFKQYLDQKGISLLYVNEPAKYIDDDFYFNEFGGQSFLNRNADLFLNRIREAGIDTIDLRDNIIKEKINPLKLFYKTDHHWTVPASKWAASVIAEHLNDFYNYNIDMSLYTDENFYITEYKNAWLGEQGKKVAKSYTGLDDYVMMEPKYDTEYTISTPQGMKEGKFDVFINKDVYNQSIDPYQSDSWHYSYNSYQMCSVENKKNKKGKILLLGDSYESSMMPFLTLGVNKVYTVIPRNLNQLTVRDIVEKGDYDIVIMAYAQFMIGAHDNINSSNYKMFNLE